MRRDEEKIATGRFCFNMVAWEESSLSGDVTKALNEGTLACPHCRCIANNVFETTSEYPATNFCVNFGDIFQKMNSVSSFIPTRHKAIHGSVIPASFLDVAHTYSDKLHGDETRAFLGRICHHRFVKVGIQETVLSYIDLVDSTCINLPVINY